MAKEQYSYTGSPIDWWDGNGKIVVNKSTSQKELGYLYTAGCEGVSKGASVDE